ncbi:cytochrome P450 94B3-like [Nymphaea colorata]|uniref:Cytochrome P450 n=1 Tax=Nymphaea colorata TaxID=210225 RepID=A0A5K1BIV8_9MAGN|nr:cytochrome P450 94B3-like [Nymphaea colorata]
MLIPVIGLAVTIFLFFVARFFCPPLFGTKKASAFQPPSHPFLGCLISFYENRHRLLDWYTELLSRSPTQTILINRLGSIPTVVTANPANVEHILKTRFHNYPKGKPFTDILGDLLGRGIFNVDGELWHWQRKVASHEFTTRSLRDYAFKTVEDEAEQRLLPLLQSACAAGTRIDLQEVLTRFNFDTACKLSFDVDPECLLPSMPACHLARAFDVAAMISAKRAAEPLPIIWKAKRLLRIGSENQLRRAIDTVHELVSQLIRDKKATSGADGKDLLSRFISMTSGRQGDEELVRDMVISFLMAGRDTTSAALTWFFWLLSRHPQVQKQILEEVGLRESRKLDFHRLKEMKFLRACLKESMRLYPPVAWDSKHAENDDVLPDGTPVAKGSRVTYFPYGMGRMESLWGNDCLEFKPERWLSKGNAQEEEMVSTYKFPIFQAGPRQCLGKELAYMEMTYLAALVLRRFEFKPVKTHEARFVPLLTARMAGGLAMLVEERQPC